MNKLLLIIFMTTIASSCVTKERPDDDYVLIEFASKLEEEYDKLEKNSPKK